MEKFLKKSIRFLAIPIFYFGIVSASNIWIYKNQSIQISDSNILIAGDSHTKRGLDPEVFSSAHNISQVSEPYVITYWKLNKIFQTYVPDTLLLGFAPHNIAAFNDYKFADKQWSNEMFRRIYSIEDFGSLDKLLPIDHSSFYKTFFREIAFYPKKDHINYLGQYENSKKSNISNWQFSIDRHYFQAEKELGHSPVSIAYLDSIISLCITKNIVPVLVNSPTHKSYSSNIPNRIKEKYISISQHYKDKTFIIDKTNNLYPDSLFYDVDHVNSYGAKKFSLEVREVLRSLKSAQNFP